MTKMKDMQRSMDQAADIAAGVSTVSVAGYALIPWLEVAALFVAIVSGVLAIAWHVYRFYQEYKSRKGGDYDVSDQRDAAVPDSVADGTDKRPRK